jgi:hypothetical protein
MNFKNLGFEMSYVNAKDMQRKLAILPQMLQILNNIFKPTLVQKFSRMKHIMTWLSPFFLHVSEIWALRKKDKNDCRQLR